MPTLLRHLLAFALAALAIAPLGVLVSGSLTGGGDGGSGGGGGGWGGYAGLLGDERFWRAVVNSALLASLQTMVGLLLASAAGYAMGVQRSSASRGMLLVIVGLSALPPQLLLPGGFEVVSALGLFDSRWAVLVPGSPNLLGALLYRGAFAALPGEVLEAARMDGAGEWRVWWQVALPMVRPTSSALLVLGFAGSWNSVVWPLLVLQRGELQTLPMRVTTLAGTAIGPEQQAVVMAATVLGILPVLALFLLLQRDFLPGLKGAVKG